MTQSLQRIWLFLSSWLWGHLILKRERKWNKQTHDAAACQRPHMGYMTSPRRHRWLWCTIVADYVWQRYLKRQKERRVADGAEKEGLFALFAGARSLFLSARHSTSEPSVPQRVWRRCSDSSHAVTWCPGSAGHVQEADFVVLVRFILILF